MPITQLTSPQQLDSAINTQIQRLRMALIYRLHIIGQKCVNEARLHRTFKDRSGHLKGSFGYVIVADGQVQDGQFGATDSPPEAQQEGLNFAHSIAGQFPKGIVLIVVAGKNYAAHVANRGYNVLQSAELLADQLVPKLLEELGLKK